MMVPAIRALRRAFPGAHIAALVNRGTEAMLTENPLIDEIITFDRSILGLPLVARWRAELRFIRGIRQRRFDAVFDFTSGDRAALYAFLSGASVRVAYDLGQGFFGKRLLYTHRVPLASRRLHAVEKDLQLVRALGCDVEDQSLALYWSAQEDEFVRLLFSAEEVEEEEMKVLVHPTSRWLFKCWRDEAMGEIISRLAAQRVRVFLTSAPDSREIERARRVRSLAQGAVIDLTGRLSLKQLAALIARCDLFIGVDSAPMHIAAAVGTPVVALFGPSGEIHWGPWGRARDGERHTVVAERRFICRPCGKAGCNDSKKSDCLDELPVDRVWEAIKRRLPQRSAR